jgi:hypothetical protein
MPATPKYSRAEMLTGIVIIVGVLYYIGLPLLYVVALLAPSLRKASGS